MNKTKEITTMDQPKPHNPLSLEQQINLRIFAQEANKLSEKGAKESLIRLYTNMIHKENYYREAIKYQWGIHSGEEVEKRLQDATDQV